MNGDELKNLWKLGFGHFHGLDPKSLRVDHDESAVRRVLRAMEAGLTEFNLKESDQLAFCFSRFLIRRDFDPNQSFIRPQIWKSAKVAGISDTKRTAQATAATRTGNCGSLSTVEIVEFEILTF